MKDKAKSHEFQGLIDARRDTRRLAKSPTHYSKKSKYDMLQASKESMDMIEEDVQNEDRQTMILESMLQVEVENLDE